MVFQFPHQNALIFCELTSPLQKSVVNNSCCKQSFEMIKIKILKLYSHLALFLLSKLLLLIFMLKVSKQDISTLLESFLHCFQNTFWFKLISCFLKFWCNSTLVVNCFEKIWSAYHGGFEETLKLKYYQ